MPIVSFRVPAEVHEALLKLAERREQTLTALMQETTAEIVERTQVVAMAEEYIRFKKLRDNDALAQPIGYATDGTPIYRGASRLKKPAKPSQT